MFIFSVLLFLMTACIKDMGTYSYTTEPDDITISSEMFRNPATQLPITFTQEMEVIIPLKYTINDPQDLVRKEATQEILPTKIASESVNNEDAIVDVEDKEETFTEDVCALEAETSEKNEILVDAFIFM